VRLCGEHQTPSSCACDADAELAAAAADAAAEAERAAEDVDNLAADAAGYNRGHDVAEDGFVDGEGDKTSDDERGNMLHLLTETDGGKRQPSEGNAREDDGAPHGDANQTTS
jgi:hypothetical protein